MAAKAKYLGLVPAGGAGQRFGAPVPKQYALLGKQRVIEHSVAALLSDQRVERVFVVVSPEDELAEMLFANHPQVKVIKKAGKERFNTVLNAVNYLLEQGLANELDWLLVHDAARPGLHPDDVTQLIDHASEHLVGGLLALPVVDTLKKTEVAEEGEVLSRQTVSREGLWAAQTPQMFRTQALALAMSECVYKGVNLTDEASAIETMGMSPLLVKGRLRNMKITLPEDLNTVWLLMQSETGES